MRFIFQQTKEENIVLLFDFCILIIDSIYFVLYYTHSRLRHNLNVRKFLFYRIMVGF